MKSSTKDIAEGKLHQVKGKIKEVVGSVVNNSDLELEGQSENLNGKIQEKIGHIEKVIEK
ncbi:CsbD family protein [Solidesulfovibrio sp.]